ncbi:MAG: hypothetical protein AAF518_04200 [Spirochaetota bacterium]
MRILFGAGLLFATFSVTASEHWIKQMQMEEKLLYDTTLASKKSQKWQKERDFDGRTYYRLGRRFFYNLREADYRQVFPKYSQLSLHLQEAKDLLQHKKYLRALRLYKGLKLCYSIQPFPYAKEIQLGIQKGMRALSLRERDKLSYTEPYACRIGKNTKNVLHLASGSYPFFLSLAGEWEYSFQEGKGTKYGEDRWSNWMFSKWRQKTTIPSRKAPFFWDGKKDKSSSPIVLAIGATRHKKFWDFSNTRAYQSYWERKRGITPAYKRMYYTEKRLARQSYLLSFQQIDPAGEKQLFYTKEMYLHKKQYGLAIFLTYPQDKASEADVIWQKIEQTLELTGIPKKNPAND